MTSQSSERERSRQYIIAATRRRLYEAAGKLKERLAKPHPPQALANPNLPKILFEGLERLGNLILEGCSWSLEIGGRLIVASDFGGHPFAPEFILTRCPWLDGNVILQIVSADTFKIQEFIDVAEGLSRVAIDLQQELLRNVIPAGERLADDEIYDALGDDRRLTSSSIVVNFSDIATRKARLLCGPHTAKRLISRLSYADLLEPDILPAFDIACNWTFSFDETNTATAIERKKNSGEPSTYFKRWWLSGAKFFTDPNAYIANILRKGLLSQAFFGEDDYLLTPYWNNSRTALTVVTRGPLITTESAVQKTHPPPPTISALLRPDRIGYHPVAHLNLGDTAWHYSTTPLGAVAHVLEGMSESAHLFRDEREPIINQHFVDRLRIRLQDSDWVVGSELSYGSGPKLAGHPDALLEFTGDLKVKIVCECKLLHNLANFLSQVLRYISSTTDSVFIVIYQTRPKNNSWDFLLAAFKEQALKLGIGLEEIHEAGSTGRSLRIGQGFIYHKLQIGGAVPFYIFLIDLMGSRRR